MEKIEEAIKEYDTDFGLMDMETAYPALFELYPQTYEYVPRGEGSTHNTWIGQPGSGLEKRQCTLQICFRYGGPQPKIAVIFRGTGQRIRKEELDAFHPDVDVYWQQNAWADTQFSVDWAKKTLREFTEKNELNRFLLICDNLTGQKHQDFTGIVVCYCIHLCF